MATRKAAKDTARNRMVFIWGPQTKAAATRIQTYRQLASLADVLRECVRSVDRIQREAIGRDWEVVIRNRKTGEVRPVPIPTLLRGD
jgi:hypothetical protein